MSNDNIHILHVLDHSLPIHSGYAFRTAEVLAMQQSFGWRVTALTGPKQELGEHSSQSAESIEYRRAPFTRSFARMPGLLQQLGVITILRDRIIDIATAQDIDILHAHSPSLNGLAAVSAGRRLRLPVVYEMRASWEDAAVDHGTTTEGSVRYRLTRATETSVLKRAARITTICEGLKAEITRRGVTESKITVIPNGVDVNRFAPASGARDELRRSFDAVGRTVLVYCGSYYAYEGLELLVESLARLKDKRPDLLLLLAGGGEQEETLVQMVADRQLRDNVRFLGRVPQSSVVALYNLADLCVFPRFRMKLTDLVTPLKPLEAMSTSAIVLASDVDGHRELIRDGETGFLFAAGDVLALSDRIIELTERTDLGRIGTAAARYVVEERTWRSVVDRYRQVYADAINVFSARS